MNKVRQIQHIVDIGFDNNDLFWRWVTHDYMGVLKAQVKDPLVKLKNTRFLVYSMTPGPLVQEEHKGYMNKNEFITALQAKNPSLTKNDVNSILESMLEIIVNSLKTDGSASIPGIVKFKAVKKPASLERQGINPFTKKMVTFAAKPESTKIKVSQTKAIKEALK